MPEDVEDAEDVEDIEDSAAVKTHWRGRQCLEFGTSREQQDFKKTDARFGVRQPRRHGCRIGSSEASIAWRFDWHQQSNQRQAIDALQNTSSAGVREVPSPRPQVARVPAYFCFLPFPYLAIASAICQAVTGAARARTPTGT